VALAISSIPSTFMDGKQPVSNQMSEQRVYVLIAALRPSMQTQKMPWCQPITSMQSRFTTASSICATQRL
jgi:hypothetical protein